MYLETLESLRTFYKDADQSVREMESACRKCCIMRDPPLLRLGGHWVQRCLMQHIPERIRISAHLYGRQRDVWDYLAAAFGKTLDVCEGTSVVDVGDLNSNICPGGFLLSRTYRNPDAGTWTHWVSFESYHVWQRCT